jgi:hypothetical protein
MRYQSKSTQFNCFSPPVMLATLIFEFGVAAYAIWRYKMNVFTRLVVSTLLALGTFQLAEYFVCTGNAGHAPAWSRLGFVAITTLPPLGLHLMHVLAGKSRRKLVGLAYATMLAFIAYFVFYSSAFSGYECTGNYVIFQLHFKSGGAYAIYYYGWLLTGLFLGARWANELMARGKQAIVRLQTVRALIVGWLIFLVPTAVANSVNPETREGIPSVMCGFAVLYALILAFYILPRAGKLKNAKA